MFEIALHLSCDVLQFEDGNISERAVEANL
jgi:hypothetical protein